MVLMKCHLMRALLVLIILGAGTTLYAYDSGIAILSETGTSMQVYVNGKLYNKQPGKYVRVRSAHGRFHLEIKVLNPWNKQWYVVRKDITIDKGYEFQYKVVFSEKTKPELKEIKRYPVYSRYFVNPGMYNSHPVS
jgi:hypothetical protein